ncbi:MAG: 50S ribosomal protein L9 [Pyrinomonadaceae bacterium]
MATTNILLKEDVDNLGGRGEVVSVKAGYARNYLLPKGIALLATKGNVKQVEQERKFLLKKAAEEKSTAEAQLEQMKSLSLTFERLSGESGTLFGSVTSIDVADALNEKGYEIDRRKVILRAPIKELGEYTVPVKLHREVTLELPVFVKAEGEVIQEQLEEAGENSDSSSSEVSEKAIEIAENSADD